MIKQFFAADGHTVVEIEETQAAALGLKPATPGEDLGAKVFAKTKASGRMPIGLTPEEAASLDRFKQETFGSYITDLPVGTTATAKIIPLKGGSLIRGNATSNGQSAKAFFACETIETIENGKQAKFNVNARVKRTPFTREDYTGLTANTLFTCEVVAIDPNDETSAKVWQIIAIA